ncbi:RNase H family protein [Kocuria atrinae]|uniref:Ribonuclease H n=1 Tax=Kocuria atrinae TaxID=592377 RepID=A0ABN2Y2S6_9MICC
MTIIAAADGSALGNPGPAGWAWFIDETSWRAGGWDHGTNNMGELTAVLNLLESTRHIPDEPLKILCDSQYVINSITKWMPGWKKKGWKKKDGKPVLNVDIMKALDREMAGRTVEFEWVKGHAGHELNEAADQRARAMASAYQAGHAEQDMPVGPGFRDSNGSVQEVPSQRSATGPANSFGDDSHEEPDLFSELWAQENDPALEEPGNAERIAQDADPANRLITLETTLLSPETSGERREELLHEDFEFVARDGSVKDSGAFLAEHRGTTSNARPDLSHSSVLALGSGAIHLSYRLTDSATVTRRSSLWIREDHHNEMGPWLLRYHQVTTES